MHWRVASLAIFFCISSAVHAAGSCADDPSPLEKCSLPAGPKPKTISGSCEFVVAGEKPASCGRIQLLLRAKGGKKHEERAAAIDGFNFKFTELGQSSYDVVTVSPEFDLSAHVEPKVLKPGLTGVKIRIDAKPRR